MAEFETQERGNVGENRSWLKSIRVCVMDWFLSSYLTTKKNSKYLCELIPRHIRLVSLC